ncbi:unnamed protein product [Angiostrongylus costaricensis]|uniref:MATH domain-containing protein n=1 Tax=Angiostrongylus costaricensis TaxID=334426 RepID=A0A0R3PSI0_ANGCS|nr:unnamed protein product [Angiostrongylus costaricensis]
MYPSNIYNPDLFPCRPSDGLEHSTRLPVVECDREAGDDKEDKLILVSKRKLVHTFGFSVCYAGGCSAIAESRYKERWCARGSYFALVCKSFKNGSFYWDITMTLGKLDFLSPINMDPSHAPFAVPECVAIIVYDKKVP